MKLKINDIKISSRIRIENTDISQLKKSIAEIGLLNPIIVNEENQLLSGFRRLTACRELGWEEIDVVLLRTTDNEVKKLDIESKFLGKNFVFDSRMAESIEGSIVSRCHQCGKPADTHVNCANHVCHLLFIQCDECANQYDACCSNECKEFIQLPEETQSELRKGGQLKFNGTSNKVRPRLSHVIAKDRVSP